MQKFVDIALNLTDPMFNGIYRGSIIRKSDMEAVVSRAKIAGMVDAVLTGTTINSSIEAFNLAARFNLHSTAGIHPTSSTEFDSTTTQKLLDLVRSDTFSRIVAIGECGLDYDRLEFASKETQMEVFKHHFQIAKMTGLPMFLHNRNTAGDFLKVITENRDMFTGGVVHSFDSSKSEMEKICGLGLYIGVNGWYILLFHTSSLKTEENVETVRAIPMDRLLVETDAPYCSMRPTHASHRFRSADTSVHVKKERWFDGCIVKGRNEPYSAVHILEVVAKIKGVDVCFLSRQVLKNTFSCFPGLLPATF